MEVSVNGKRHQVDVAPDMPLLWVLRDELGIMGPKYGCGIAQFGACTVHIDGAAARSCQHAVGDLAGGCRESAPYSLHEHVNDILEWGVAGMPCPQE